MTATGLAALISGIGLLLSVLVSVFVSGASVGRIRRDVDWLLETRKDMATKAQLDVVAGDVKEIKGMFRVTLDPQYGGRE